MGTARIPLGISPLELPRGMHVCYVSGDDDERMDVVARFLAAGSRAGDRLFYLVDTSTPAELRQRLASLGLDADESFAVMRSEDMYRPQGTFSVEASLDVIRAFVAESTARGFGGARGAGEMGWVVRDPDPESASKVIEFEARINYLFRDQPCTALCQYDARLFDGEMIMDVLTVHPYTIVRGQVIENPYYIEPEEFLRGRAPHRPPGHAAHPA